MTAEQMALIIKVFQFGFASGMTDRFEMIRRYCQGYPELQPDIIAAATAFERGCGLDHEQTEQLRNFSENQFAIWLGLECIAEERAGQDAEILELLTGFLNNLINTRDHDGYSLSEISKLLGRSSDRDLVNLVLKLQGRDELPI